MTGGRGPVGEDCQARGTDEGDDALGRRSCARDDRARTGRVRPRKYVVTDEVQQTVPVKRDRGGGSSASRSTDATRDAAMSGGDLTEEEDEVTLDAEGPVVEKRTVPKERIRLEKDVEIRGAHRVEDVRREEIDVDDSTTRDR